VNKKISSMSVSHNYRDWSKNSENGLILRIFGMNSLRNQSEESPAISGVLKQHASSRKAKGSGEEASMRSQGVIRNQTKLATRHSKQENKARLQVSTLQQTKSHAILIHHRTNIRIA
jgi:hypothetical protein